MSGKLPPWLDGSREQFHQLRTQNRMPHAVLLLGPDGLGKRALARWLSGLVLCEMPDAAGPCGQCRGCKLFAAGTHPDFRLSEPAEGKKQIGVDQIRDLINNSSLTGTGYRVFVIAPAEGLNASSANALLKTLEEPTPGTLLILLAQRRSALPATILSRCRAHVIGLPKGTQAEQWLIERTGSSTDAVKNALSVADGNLALARQILDGTSGLEQLPRDLVAVAQDQVDLSKLVASWTTSDAAGVLDARLQLMSGLVRDLAWARAGVDAQQTASRGSAHTLPDELRRLTGRVDLATLFSCYQYINNCRSRLRGSLRPELQVEELLLNWQKTLVE